MYAGHLGRYAGRLDNNTFALLCAGTDNPDAVLGATLSALDGLGADPSVHTALRIAMLSATPTTSA